jgi:uncharacterized RDD family membrane protein YckC
MTNADLQQKRLIAAAIDAGIAMALIVVVSVVAGLAAFVAEWLSGLLFVLGYIVVLGYVLVRDTLAGGRSFGKKIQEIKVVNTYGAPITLIDSVKRNAIFGVGLLALILWSFFQMLPVIGCIASCVGWPLVMLASLGTLAGVVVEILKVIQDPQGVRFGDQLAKTRVVE